MTREELLKQCKFYKGEEKNPFSYGLDACFWDKERIYVRHGGNFVGEGDYYVAHNFKEFDMPNNLLIVMFTSWAKTEYDIPGSISNFYEVIETYLSK